MKGWYPSPQALYTTDFRLTELQACCRGRKTPPAQSGWTTANTGVPLALTGRTPWKPRCRGHGPDGVASGVRGDMTSGQHLSSLYLGASGEQVGSHRQAELCMEPHSRCHQGPSVYTGLGTRLHTPKAKGHRGSEGVDPVFVFHRAQHCPLSPAPGPRLPVEGEEIWLARDEELQCFL